MSTVTRESERSRTRRTRVAILAQVVLGIALAVAAALLLTWLSERRGFRARFDLTATSENTLDPVTVSVIEKLPTEVAIDVFFRAGERELEMVSAQAQDRMKKLMRRAADESGGKIVVEDHDLSNPAKLPARTQSRMQELKLTSLEPGGLIVLSAGTRREIVRLRPDIADLDPGQQAGPGVQYMPPRLVSFRGEEALTSALLKVSLATTQRVYVVEGHGEPSTKAVDPLGLALLESELSGDGFEVRTWNGARQGALPGDCDVLAILGPEQKLSPSESAEVRRFVEAGGRLIASPGRRPIEGQDSLAELLDAFGVKVDMHGFVAHPVPQVGGGPPMYEIEDCADLWIGPEGMPALNPITEPLRRSERRVQVRAARVLQRSETPASTPASVRDLLRAPEDSWHELPKDGTEDRFDWKPAEGAERARFLVAVQSSFSPRRKPPERATSDERSRPESRVIVVGSTDVFVNQSLPSNRDFVLNAFNWAASREYRVRVAKSNPETRRIDVKTEGTLSRMTLVAIVGLPLLCAVLGIVTVWRRNRR